LKLNLGCGVDIKAGYHNCDVRFVEGIDRVFDISYTNYPFGNESVEEVFCYHVLEHIPYRKWGGMFSEWHRILKNDGKVIIGYPDLKDFLKKFLVYRIEVAETSNIETRSEMVDRFWNADAIMTINGAQKNEFDAHISMFDDFFVINQLERIGFVVSKSFDKNGLVFECKKRVVE
jgi:predicted SAM-dependent methyltransferase